MPTRGRFICHVHYLVHDGAVRSSPCRPHHENFGRNLYHMFGLFRKPILCFVLSCGIRVASMSSIDSIPSPNGVLILRCEYQSFLIIKFVLSILFNRRASLQVDPIISTSARPSISSSQRRLFHPSPSCFFSRPPSLVSFKDSEFLIIYHVIDVKSLHFFPSMLLSGDPKKDSNGASSSPFFVLFLLRWIQVKLC